MARKPTFTLLRRDGTAEVVAFTPLMVIAGTQVHRLALHRDALGDWVVSHPDSGAAVIRRLSGWFKGCPVSTAPYTLAEARKRAQEQVDDLIQRVGSERFNAVLANPKPF